MKPVSVSDRELHIHLTEDLLGQIHNQMCEDFLVAESENRRTATILATLKELQLPYENYLLTFKDYEDSYVSHRLDTTRTTTGGLVRPKKSDHISKSDDIESPFEDDIDRVRQLYIGVLDSVYCLTGRCPSQKAMNNFIKRYFLYSMINKLEDAFKFHTAYLVCKLTKLSELPKRPDFIFETDKSDGVIGGWIRRYLQSSKISSQRKIQLAMSLQNAKRAAKVISLFKQQQAIVDHQQNMVGNGYKPYPNTEWMLSEVKQKVRSLTKIYYPPNLDEKIPVWRTPSYGACFENTGIRGGSSEYFCNKFTRESELDYWRHYGIDKTPSFWNFEQKWTRETLKQFEELSMTAHHYGDISYKENIPLFSFGFSIRDIREKLNNNITYRILSNQRTACRYSMVLEPFKVRGVTMGNAETYQMGRLIQPVLHGQIRDEKGPFRFIGKRHNDDDINDVYDGTILHTQNYFNYVRLFEDFSMDKEFSDKDSRDVRTFLVAGDYKNATDNMHPDLPYTFIEALRENKSFSDLWLNVLELTLNGHIIDYEPICNGHTGLDFAEFPEFKMKIIQEWGQLMGSPTSFPILCIVNASMLWAACEIYENRPLSWNQVLTRYRPLFNGDDISFSSNPLHYDTWAVLCAACGLSLSPGKNYCSSEFVNINSTNYFAEEIIEYEDGSYRLGKFKELFVVNAGLIKGQSKVLGDSGDYVNSLGSTCDQLEECIRVADNIQKTRCYQVFEYHMRDKLKSSKRPWTLPRLFGGLGLPFGEKPSLPQYLTALSQFEKYRDLTDDSLQKINDRQANDYWRQICSLHNIEVIKPTLVRDDVKTSNCNQEPTLYENPSLTPSFLNSPERERTISAAKSLLYNKHRRSTENINIYDQIFRLPEGKKKDSLKKKLKRNLIKIEKGRSEIEQKRLGHKLQAEKTYCRYLRRWSKLVASMKGKYDNDIKVPDDYQAYFEGYTLSKGGLQSEVCINVSKSLQILN